MTNGKLLGDPQIPVNFLESLGIGAFLTEAQSRQIAFINRRSAALVGYSSEEVNARKMSLNDLIDPRDREAEAAEYTRLLRGEIGPYALEVRCLRRNGESFWAHITVALVRDEHDEPRACAVAVGEMSQRQILEQQLEGAMRLAGMMSWCWDVKSVRATTSGDSIVGPSTTTSLGVALLKIHPDDRRAVETTISRAVATGTGYSHEYRTINSSGGIRYMRGTVTCLRDEAGDVTHLVGTTIDITDIKSRQGAEQAPRAIRDILKHIETNWNKPIYLEEIARQHGISPRAVQRYFASRGMKPLAKYVKQLRLRRAHQALGDPKPRTSVTGVALYCGFLNPGHFARDYREEFGELPSETLRKGLYTLERKLESSS